MPRLYERLTLKEEPGIKSREDRNRGIAIEQIKGRQNQLTDVVIIFLNPLLVEEPYVLLGLFLLDRRTRGGGVFSDHHLLLARGLLGEALQIRRGIPSLTIQQRSTGSIFPQSKSFFT